MSPRGAIRCRVGLDGCGYSVGCRNPTRSAATVPDWRTHVAHTSAHSDHQRNQRRRISQLVGGGLAAWGMWRLWRKIHWEAA